MIEAIPIKLKNKLDEVVNNYQGLSQLNIIRCDQKDFSYSALKLEIKKVTQITELYQLCKTLIPSLQLSNNAVRYYAIMAEHYHASRTRKLANIK